LNHIEPGMGVRGEIERGVAMKRECTPSKLRKSAQPPPTPSKFPSTPRHTIENRNSAPPFSAPPKFASNPTHASEITKLEDPWGQAPCISLYEKRGKARHCWTFERKHATDCATAGQDVNVSRLAPGMRGDKND